MDNKDKKSKRAGYIRAIIAGKAGMPIFDLKKVGNPSANLMKRKAIIEDEDEAKKIMNKLFKKQQKTKKKINLTKYKKIKEEYLQMYDAIFGTFLIEGHLFIFNIEDGGSVYDAKTGEPTGFLWDKKDGLTELEEEGDSEEDN